MSHLKVLTRTEVPLTDLLGPLPSGGVPVKIPDEDPSDALAKAVIRGHLEEAIRTNSLCVSLVLPPCLLDTVADSVIQLAKDEPCGLRGSVLRISLVEEKPHLETEILKIKADPSTPTTHKLSVILRPDPESWYTKMANIFRSLAKRRLVISPKFELSKTTLYNF